MRVVGITRLAMAGLLVAAAGIAAGAAAARADVLIGLVEMQTGGMAISWQDQLRQATELAVAKLNAGGGVLGQQVRTIVGDDACDGGQAVALANKFVSEGVVFVAGHPCSDASIPASPVYAEAGILMISPVSTNPMLTERGLTNVFRVVGRDDAQGIMAGNYLADRWSERRIAVLHDGTPYVKGLAEETKKQLNARGVAEGLYEQVEREAVDYGDLLDRIQGVGIDVVYFPGRDPEVGLFIRQARNRGMKFQLVTGDNNVTESFRMIAGNATEGTLLTSYPDPREIPRRPSWSQNSARASFRRICHRSTCTPRSRSGRRRSRRPGPSRSPRSARCCARRTSTPCSAASASTTKATSPASTRSSGTSGKATPPCRWTRPSWPSDHEAPT
jgi:branched-chain amino acid transport system substrate-binding protein